MNIFRNFLTIACMLNNQYITFNQTSLITYTLTTERHLSKSCNKQYKPCPKNCQKRYAKCHIKPQIVTTAKEAADDDDDDDFLICPSLMQLN